MANYQKAKDIFLQRRTPNGKFEEYALIVHPSSYLISNAANDIVAISASDAVIFSTASWAFESVHANTASYANTSSYALYSTISSTASYIDSATNAFIQGGNSFGTSGSLGLNDNKILNFKVNNNNVITLSGSAVSINKQNASASLDVNYIYTGTSNYINRDSVLALTSNGGYPWSMVMRRSDCGPFGDVALFNDAVSGSHGSFTVWAQNNVIGVQEVTSTDVYGVAFRNTTIINPISIYANSIGYGTIFTPSASRWSLGYTADRTGSVSTSSLTWDNIGNVSIGTINSGAKLHVQGNISASSVTASLFGLATSASYSILSSTASLATTASYSIISSTASYLEASLTNVFVEGGNTFTSVPSGSLGLNDNKILNLKVNNNVVMTLSGSAIGINRPNPTANLDIKYVSLGVSDYLNIDTVLSLTTNNTFPWSLVLRRSDAGTIADVALRNDSVQNSHGSFAFWAQSQPIGIREACTIDVYGLKFTHPINPISIISDATYGTISTPSANRWSLGYTADRTGSVSTSSLTWDNSGNVSVGTINPGAKLHVQGNISASSVTASLFGLATSASYAITTFIPLVVQTGSLTQLLTSNTSSYNALFIKYKMKDSVTSRMGNLNISFTSTNTSFSDTYTNDVLPEVNFSCSLSGALYLYCINSGSNPITVSFNSVEI